MSRAKAAKAAKDEGEKREGSTRAEARRRGGLGGRVCTKGQKATKGRQESGREVGIENHENRFADIEKREGRRGAAGTRESCPRGSRNAKKQAEPFSQGSGQVNTLCLDAIACRHQRRTRVRTPPAPSLGMTDSGGQGLPALPFPAPGKSQDFGSSGTSVEPSSEFRECTEQGGCQEPPPSGRGVARP